MKNKSLFLVFVAVFGWVFSVEAQETESSVFDYLFERNHFSIGYNQGFSTPSLGEGFGEFAPSLERGTVFRFDLEYTLNLSQNWGINLGVGQGRFPLYANHSLSFFDEWAMLGRLSLGVNYRSRLSQRYVLQSYAGATVNWAGAHITSRSTGDFMGSTRRSEIHLRGQSSVFGGFLGAGISRVLPGGNMVTLRAGFNYAFSNFMEGDYSLYLDNQIAAEGEVYSSGHYPEFGLAYTFTGAGKAFKISQMAAKSDKADYKSVKKDIRIADRKEFLERKYKITMSLGGNSVNPSMSGETGDFRALNQGGFSAGIALEHDLKNHFFAEGGLGFSQFWPGMNNVSSNSGTLNASIMGSYRIDVYTASLGAGYRLTGSENYYNYLNLHAGATVGYAPDMQISSSPQEKFFDDYLNSNVHAQGVVIERFSGQNNVFPMLYLGASKDLKIASNFYFNVNYRRHFGLMTVYNMDLLTSEPGSETQRGTAKIRSIGSLFQIGVRFAL